MTQSALVASALAELAKVSNVEYDLEYMKLCIGRAEHVLREGLVKETYQELLKRHAREREECIERERKENMMVTLQVNDLGGPEDKPFIIEIVFPSNLTTQMKTAVNNTLHALFNEKWLGELGYKFKWLTARNILEWEAIDSEKKEREFR